MTARGPIHVVLSMLAFLATVGRGAEPVRDDNIDLLTFESMRRQQYDEAEERLHLWMESHPDDPNLGKAIHRLAKYYSVGPRGGDRAKAISLLQHLVHKHSDANEAVAWWLDLGVTLERAGQTASAITALERGMSMLGESKTAVARDLPDDAFEWLGGYYIDNEMWDRAVDVLEKWSPSADCGTCREQMENFRSHGIVLSLIQSARHSEAANKSWQIVTRKHFYTSDMASLALIRLYHEAGQLTDLKEVLAELAGGSDRLSAALAALDRGDKPWKLGPRQANAARIMKALALVDDRRFETRLAPFLATTPENALILNRLDSRVAAWLLIRDRKVFGRHVRVASRDAIYHQEALTAILDLMANPHHFGGSAKSPHTELANRFVTAWPKPKPGALPKKLPLVTESTVAR